LLYPDAGAFADRLKTFAEETGVAEKAHDEPEAILRSV